MAFLLSRCFLGAISILLVACGGPGPQEQKLPPGAGIKVNATSRLVTLEIKNVPFREVLSELGRQAQIAVSVPDNLQFDNLSLSFENIPLEDALKRVLAGQSYSFVYAQDRGHEVITGVNLFAKQEQAPPAEIRTAVAQVLASMSGSGTAGLSELSDRPLLSSEHTSPKALRDDMSLEDLKRSFSEAQDPATRSQVLEAMAGLEAEEAQPIAPVLATALSDSDEGVRTTALNLLRLSSDPVPIGPLSMMSATDENPDLRLEAMTLMTDQLFLDASTNEDRMAVKASLTQSLSDPDPDIREQAASAIDEFSQIGLSPRSKKSF